MSSRQENFLALALLCLLVLLPFWRVATGRGLIITNDVAVSDITHLQYPLRYYAGQTWQQGQVPLWVPGVYMGFPLLAEGQAGVFYPLHLLSFRLLPVHTALILDVLAPFVIAATGAYLLARTLGAGVSGALLAGFSYAFSGFFVAHVKHMPIVNTACWIPLVLWLVELGLRRSDRALLGAGLLLAVQWLAGSPQLAYYSAAVATLYFAGRAWMLRGERSPRRAVPLFGLALLLSAGLAALQLLPTYELVQSSERAGGVSYDFATRFSYALANLKTFLYPLANGTPGTGDLAVSSIFWEDYAYFGLLPLCLALFGGLALVRRSSLARLLFGLLTLTFLLALGPHTPLHRLAYEIVPGMAFFRFPQRLFAATLLFASLLAGLALTHWARWLEQRGKSRSRTLARGAAVLALLLTVIDLYAYHADWNAIVDADTWLTPPPTAPAVQERAGSSLFRVFTYDAYDTFRAAYRRAGGWRGDLGPYVAQRDFLQPSLNLVYDVPAADGYINLVPDCLADLWGTEKQQGLMDAALVPAGDRLLVRPGFVRLLSLYNVRFVITDTPVQDEALDLVGRYDSGAQLYENLETLPRAFAVPDFVVAQDIGAALTLMRSPSFDPLETVVLMEPPDVPPAEPEGQPFESAVRVVSYEPTRVVVEADLNAAGWLVLSDTHYPGWEATVDGSPAHVYRANGCVRAVVLEKGRHAVVLRFRPAPFYRGAVISAVSGLLFAGVWLVLKAKQEPDGA